MIESLICYNITLWRFSISCADKAAIKRICKQAKIIKTDILSRDDIYVKDVPRKVKHVISMETHPLHNYFFHMRPETRLRVLPCKTQRYRKSFVPNSTDLFKKY